MLFAHVVVRTLKVLTRPIEMDTPSLLQSMLMFDRLLQQCAASGGHLTPSLKRALDRSLELRARACQHLKISPHADTSAIESAAASAQISGR